MLFHVPDLNKALLEVKRVLKDNGVFYSATDGNGGMRPFLHNAIVKFEPKSISGYSDESLSNLYNYFEDIREKDGAINIPRETGVFISIK